MHRESESDVKLVTRNTDIGAQIYKGRINRNCKHIVQPNVCIMSLNLSSIPKKGDSNHIKIRKTRRGKKGLTPSNTSRNNFRTMVMQQISLAEGEKKIKHENPEQSYLQNLGP